MNTNTNTNTNHSLPPSRPSSSAKLSKQEKNNSNPVVVLLLELGIYIATGLLASYLIRKIMSQTGLQGSAEDQKAATAAEQRLSKLLEERGKAALPALTSYESMMAQDVLNPREITVNFKDIGGMDQMKQEIWELAVLPLQRPDLFSGLLSQPGGILLYGPPGTGKTMLAKAIAREADATFITIKLSKIMNKWFGESNKLIDATFSLATKLAPSIIFIDELDTFLNPRDGTEGSAGSAIKAEFLTLWDGMTTKDGNILVLGATNRPNHVDGAILRRLPRSFRISLPDVQGRLQILQLTLENHPMDEEALAFIPELAKLTVGYSGSDLKEMCKCAALESVRELMRETSRQAVSGDSGGSMAKALRDDENLKLRPMMKKDMLVATQKVKRTGQDAAEYERSEFSDKRKQQPGTQIDTHDMMQNLAALSKLLTSKSGGEEPEEEEDEDEMPVL
jgi:SpoVK/Ycf46/Vps4 family AAA+-type ATPase